MSYEIDCALSMTICGRATKRQLIGDTPARFVSQLVPLTRKSDGVERECKAAGRAGTGVSTQHVHGCPVVLEIVI